MALELRLREERQRLGPTCDHPAPQGGLSPPLPPHSQPGWDPSPLGLALVQADLAWLADVSLVYAGGLPDPKAVADTEDGKGEDSESSLEAHRCGHGSEHAQGSPNLMASFGVVGPTSPGRNGRVDGTCGGPQSRGGRPLGSGRQRPPN